MPKAQPDRVKAIWNHHLEAVYYLEFQYDYLHYAVVQDFIIRMEKKTSLDYIWKNGITISHQDSQALVMANMQQKVIHIRTMGRHRDYLLSAIRKNFRQQSDKDSSVTIRVSNNNVHYVDLAELKESQQSNTPNVPTVDKSQFLPVVDFRWALQEVKEADLEKLLD